MLSASNCVRSNVIANLRIINRTESRITWMAGIVNILWSINKKIFVFQSRWYGQRFQNFFNDWFALGFQFHIRWIEIFDMILYESFGICEKVICFPNFIPWIWVQSRISVIQYNDSNVNIFSNNYNSCPGLTYPWCVLVVTLLYFSFTSLACSKKYFDVLNALEIWDALPKSLFKFLFRYFHIIP